MSLEWFPFAPKSFITDTLRLSTEAKGAYLMLMLDYYDQERPAPDDDDVLASITGLPIETWRRHRRVIAPLFDVRDGCWYHVKCEEVLATQHAKMLKIMDAAAASVAARAAKRTGGKASAKASASTSAPASVTTNVETTLEANFGPTERAFEHPLERTLEQTLERPLPNTSKSTGVVASVTTDVAASVQTDVLQNSRIEEGRREGANAPSLASGLSIGSLLDPEWTLNAEQVAIARDEGVPMNELGHWLDDWKSRCIDAGTRVDDWSAAWAREYHRRMTERAKAKPKPKVSVSKKPKAEGRPMPDNWQLSADLIAFAHKYRQDANFIADELRNYCANNPTKYSNHDAAFRTFVLRRAKENGQAQTTQRRAPAPGGSSILDAFDRLDATLAGASGAPAQDQPHGKALVHRVPEE